MRACSRFSWLSGTLWCFLGQSCSRSTWAWERWWSSRRRSRQGCRRPTWAWGRWWSSHRRSRQGCRRSTWAWGWWWSSRRRSRLGRPSRFFAAFSVPDPLQIHQLLPPCRWRQGLRIFSAVCRAASGSSPHRQAEKVSIGTTLTSTPARPHLSDKAGKKTSAKSCGHVSHLGRDGGEPGVAGHLLLQQVVEGQVEARRGGIEISTTNFQRTWRREHPLPE